MKASLQWDTLGSSEAGDKGRKVGVQQTSCILGNGAGTWQGLSPHQPAPALQQPLRDAAELPSPSSQTASLAAVIYIPRTALFTQTA